MNILNTRIVLPVLLAITGLLLLAKAKAQAQESAESPLGVYGKTSTYCGAEAIPQNPTTIPQIGCFYLSAGRGATGTFATHRVELSVNGEGKEVFKVDGTYITDNHETATWTNLPYVSVGGVAGYSICKEPTDRNSACPSRISIFSRNPDKTVLFMVTECLPPGYHLCVTTESNWEYEKSRQH
jgi:hypothetical protein